MTISAEAKAKAAEVQTKLDALSEANVRAKLQKLRPVIKNDEGRLYYIDLEGVSLRGDSYIWKRKVLEYVDDVHETPLQQVGTEIDTFHTFGYHGYFKPSIFEVFASIPDEIFNNESLVAFEIFGPQTADDLNEQVEYVHAGLHRAKVRFYAATS